MEDILGKSVMVYRNLHNGKFSVLDRKTYRLLCHASSICLSSVEFKVREGGRQRVIKTKSKNVHAFVCGVVTESVCADESFEDVSYNPYRAGSFFLKKNNRNINKCFLAMLSNGNRIQAKIHSDH
jgi:hypothetical protein